MNFEEWHTCHFCGTQIDKLGYEFKGNRHYLSDCRPDLVEHEIGDKCTWDIRRKPIESKTHKNVLPPLPENETCYAYQDEDGNITKEHIHFYPDGPM